MISVLICILGCLGCSGYRFGNGSLYRPDVQTVSVSIAQSESLRPYLGERLTEAVIRQIHLKTPYRVTTAENAQTFLQLNLQNDTKLVLGENVNDEPRALQVGMGVAVTWTNRMGQSLIAQPDIVVVDEANFVPEGGQSMTTAQQDVIDRIARQIVSRMETDW